MVEEARIVDVDPFEVQSVLDRLRSEDVEELRLAGGGAEVNPWPPTDDWDDSGRVYRLLGSAPALAEFAAAAGSGLRRLQLRRWPLEADDARFLTNLTHLDLSNNYIGPEGTAALADLTNLTHLDLSNNNIGPEGTAALADLTNLTYLDLSNNNIGPEGTAALADLTNLTRLESDYNNIGPEGTAALAGLTNLTRLTLDGNRLGDEGAIALRSLANLTEIWLDHNEISDQGAQALAGLSRLSFLTLEGNHVADAGAEALAKVQTLSRLWINTNQIGDAGARALAAHTSLWELRLGDNRMTDLRPFVPMLDRGMSIGVEPGSDIYVGGNPIEDPPIEIVQRGREAVLSYFAARDVQGTAQLNEAKVVLVGEGRSGKTSLLRRLYRPDLGLPSEAETTHGIEIHRHGIERADGTPFWLNVWDFGGQDIYRSTHQFFLTRRSLYVLLDDSAKDDRSAHDPLFRYWLDAIEVLSGASPVIIFQNQKAGRSKDIDLAGIQDRFPNVIGLEAGDLIEPNAADGIRAQIDEQAQLLPHVGDPVPARWVDVRDAIAALPTPFITEAQYLELYAETIDDDHALARRLSEYLHDLGVFLHFQDHPVLRRWVFLENEWVTKAVFAVIDDETIKVSGGHFDTADYRRLWAADRYDDMHHELLALMERFELCYRLDEPGEPTWLVPQLLPAQRPPSLREWEQPRDIGLIFRYEFLPAGLIARLHAREHWLVADRGQAWRSGVLFERQGSQLLAAINARGDELRLRARGPQARELLAAIAHDLEDLHRSFGDLAEHVQRLVPCICERCEAAVIPHHHQEAQLLRRRKDGKGTIECPESYIDVDVRQLLEGAASEVPVWSTATATRRGEIPVTELQVFVASSEQLTQERDALSLYLRDRSLLPDLQIRDVRSEHLSGELVVGGSQTRFDTELEHSDLAIFVVKDAVGTYLRHEFEVACGAFEDDAHPLVLVVMHEGPNINHPQFQTVAEFRQHLRDIGHHPLTYREPDDLARLVGERIIRLHNEGRLRGRP